MSQLEKLVNKMKMVMIIAEKKNQFSEKNPTTVTKNLERENSEISRQDLSTGPYLTNIRWVEEEENESN